MEDNDARQQRRRRKQQNICTAHDYAELLQAYRFIPPDDDDAAAAAAAAAGGGGGGGAAAASGAASSASAPSTWQDRMARRYESHLYREFVLADLTRYKTAQIGLRWRTKDEVTSGKGFDTCGNKHCPSYRVGGDSSLDIEAARRAALSRTSQDAVRLYNIDASGSSSSHNAEQGEEEQEEARLSNLPNGCGVADYEVPFSYTERDVRRVELVKLRLCLRCAPMLFYGRGGAMGAKRARDMFHGTQTDRSPSRHHRPLKTCDDSFSSPLSQSSNSTVIEDTRERKRRRRKKESGRKRNKKKTGDDHRKDRGRRKKSRRARSGSTFTPDSSDEHPKLSGNRQGATSPFDSDDSEGVRAEKELLSNLEACR